MDHCPHLKMQLDIGWSWYANADTEALIQKYGDRIVSIHLKDFTEDARERNDDGRFTAIGAGAVSISSILAMSGLCDLKADRIIIDQDGTGNTMYGDLEKGLEYLLPFIC